jgi:ABC-type multidrug transport system fused ATPase/permease subunit
MILKEHVKNTIEQNFIPNANAILIFILILSGNYLDDFFPCKVQDLMRNNLIMKHLVGFMILYFLTILTIPELKSIRGIFSAIGLYVLFLLSTKINYIAWAIVLFIYVVVYLMNIAVGDLIKQDAKDGRHSKKNNRRIQLMRRIMSWLFIINILIIVIGFIYYYGMKRMQHGNNFNLKQFFFGIPDCGYKIKQKDVLKPFVRAFKKK